MQNEYKHPTMIETVRVYRGVLSGELLNEIKTTDEIKNAIREFMKYSHLPGHQISEKTGMSTDIACQLRLAKRAYVKRSQKPSRQAGYPSSEIAFAAKHLMNGGTANSARLLGIREELIAPARKCIRILEEGGGERELFKAGLAHDEIESLIKLYNQKKETIVTT